MISQGYNGPWSHKMIRPTTDQRFSLDFALPFGTDVIAARDGKITLFTEKYNQCYTGLDLEIGKDFTANLINILHSDGTMACYQHMQGGSMRSLELKVGGYVKQGQLIGKTGPSGWVGEFPHLHFMVYERRLEAY